MIVTSFLKSTVYYIYIYQFNRYENQSQTNFASGFLSIKISIVSFFYFSMYEFIFENTQLKVCSYYCI